ncbi:Chromate transporter [Leptothrix cholodnii SP-6]|uniref:Chromate transporter n=1 Tax=Leptothrix cholodnii (strain ATCC 51168 / LMG 8142 / SP-6) TaxID=395495 RepID=B1Y5Z9_LEPCP|nr:chromate transporter [Leptothrix cholodnii]ACB32346.1 Chromate transporter [Leptothrix cholodnii SP-6]
MTPIPLHWLDWLQLLGHFAALSLLSVGGAITVASDLHRRLVLDHHWLSDGQFSASIALAQAAPGPNLLFVGLVGWHVGLNAGATTGLNAGGYATATAGLLLSLSGALLPSSVLTLTATRWARRHRDDRAVRAFKQGMAPLVIGMMLATAAVLNLASGPLLPHWPMWALSAAAAWAVWATGVHLLWLLAAGALLGALGWV